MPWSTTENFWKKLPFFGLENLMWYNNNRYKWFISIRQIRQWDISKAASYKNGYVIIGKLPPDDYIVYISDILTSKVILHISEGKLFDIDCRLGEYVLSNSRILQLSEDNTITNYKY